MIKAKLKNILVGVALTAVVSGSALAESNGVSDNAWLQGMMRGMEMMGGKMKDVNMVGMKSMAVSSPAMVIIDMRSGRMVAIDAAMGEKYFSATP